MATSRRPPASAASSTPVRIGRASSLDAARTTWVSAAASSAPARVTGSPLASVSRGNSSAGSTRRLNSDRAAEMRASSSATSTETLPGGQGSDDVGRQPAGQDDDAVGLAGHGDLDRDRELEVGAREAQLVAGQLDLDPGQHGQGGAATRRRSAGGAEGFDEDITLASELHAGTRFLPSSCCLRTKQWW